MMADQKTVLRLLKTARGQIDGIIKMVEEDRYCIDISNQLMACQSVLGKANKLIIKGHMEHCVKSAFGGEDATEKIEELLGIFDKLAK